MRYSYLALAYLVFGAAACQTVTKRGAAPTLTITDDGENYRISNAGKPVISYNYTIDLPDELNVHYQRSGYFHPLTTPAGIVVTDDFPENYAHQHGIFTAWTKTRFRGQPVDFWNTHQETGAIRHLSTELLETAGGTGLLSFMVTLGHYALLPDSVQVLREELRVSVTDRSDVHVWDLESVQHNVTQDTLYLDRHVYGGLGIRGSKHWNEQDSVHYHAPAQFLTSQGYDRSNGNHTEAEWTSMYGDTPLGMAGMAVLPHPDNLRWPPPVRLHPSLPYFSVSPIIFEPYLLAPGEELRSRYRFVAFDGEADPGLFEELSW